MVLGTSLPPPWNPSRKGTQGQAVGQLSEGQVDGRCWLPAVPVASLCPRMLRGCWGPLERVGGTNGNCSCGLPAWRACSPAAWSPLASALPAPSLPLRRPEMAVTMVTLLILSGDNEANVFFISMNWSEEQSGEGAFPSHPSFLGRDSEWGLTCRRTDTS